MLGWADKYTHLLFNKKKIINENFFSMLTIDSKFKIECIFKGKFLKNVRKNSKMYIDDNEDGGSVSIQKSLDNIKEDSRNKENVFSYNIWNMQMETKAYENNKDFLNEIFVNYLNESRSCTSRFDVIIHDKQERILMETRFSKKRDFNNDMYFFHNFR